MMIMCVTKVLHCLVMCGSNGNYGEEQREEGTLLGTLCQPSLSVMILNLITDNSNTE